MPKSQTPLSERRLAVNRANARKSTGPKSAGGKARSSLNALKTGLTGHTVLLPAEDAEAYRAHVDRLLTAFAPVGVLEEQLVHTLADLQWRLQRIPSLESGALALARHRTDPALFADEPDESIRAVLLAAHVQDVAAKSLETLHRQEQRLRRQYAQENKELARLQAERKEAARQAERESALREACAHVLSCPCETFQESREFLFGSFGFGRFRQAVASNFKNKKDEPALPPQVVIVDGRQPSPASA